MAMGSWVKSETNSYLTCVYFATYRAVENFLKKDTKWFDMLQLTGPGRLRLTLFLVRIWMAVLSCLHALYYH